MEIITKIISFEEPLFFPGPESYKMKHSDWLTSGPEFQSTKTTREMAKISVLTAQTSVRTLTSDLQLRK